MLGTSSVCLVDVTKCVAKKLFEQAANIHFECSTGTLLVSSLTSPDPKNGQILVLHIAFGLGMNSVKLHNSGVTSQMINQILQTAA